MSKSMISVRIALAAAGLASIAAPAPAQTATQIIAKARAYLGDNAALEAVKSVHFVGTMETEDPTPEGLKKAKSSIEIIFQKPYQQRIIVTMATTIQTTGLDDYDGWQRVQEKSENGRWRLTLLQPGMIKKLRANTWENLNFYKGIEKRGGSVQVIGPVTVDGIATIKAVFIHEPGIAFSRYFDAATGRLVVTETDRGDRIREDGEIMVDRLRFPRKVTSIGKATDAKGQTVEIQTVIAFERITLNETFPESDFEVPMMIPPHEEPPPAVVPPADVPPDVMPPDVVPPPVVPPIPAPTASETVTKP